MSSPSDNTIRDFEAAIAELESIVKKLEDGDLSPLLRLPRLREIRMRDRRDYRPRLKALETQLGIA